jgi:WS/DGAT/MGAT family acyltransferase
MHRMSGQDAHFIYDESPTEPQHTLKISFLGPAASAAWSFEASRCDLERRLPGLEPLRWRAVRVPLDLHHPVWVRDPELDLSHHLRRMRVPSPGGREELCGVISEILSQPLDPDRPLWELWWLEGYEGGVVSVLKMSHALADGGESRRLLERLYSQTPLDDDDARTPSAPLEGEPLPSRRRLVLDALRDLVHGLRWHVPHLVRATRAARRRIAAARAEGSLAAEPAPNPLAGPPTSMGGRLSSRRAFHFFSVPLADALSLRRSLGCTVNDVVVAAVTGGVRRYLYAQGELPGVPVIGYMPASIRSDRDQQSWGNRVTARPLALPTHLADPLARLRAIQSQTARAKQEIRLLSGAHLEDWLAKLPPVAAKTITALMRSYVRFARRLPGLVSISSVAGPREVLHTRGGPVENFVSVGHMKYSAGLNSTVWSYAGNLNFGFYACARAVPDLGALSDAVAESFEELSALAARADAERLAA